MIAAAASAKDLEPDLWLVILIYVVVIAIMGLMIFGLLRLNHFIFRRIHKHKQGLHLAFFERLISAVILIGGIILIVSAITDVSSIWKTLLGGTAIVSAVLAFAAQDSVKDIIAGLMISIYKPFEIGNRIELEDGTAGIVKDITMRHVVLLRIDSQYEVIPNSRLNAMNIQNYSYHTVTRSMTFRFFVSYDTDVEQAMQVIRDAVIASPYTIPGKQTEAGMDYGPVYFMEYEASSLQLTTSVYYTSEHPSEVVRSDVNLRVNKALKQHGIEIPYNYVNVIEKPQEPSAPSADEDQD